MNIKISIALMAIGIIIVTLGGLFKILHYSIANLNGSNIILSGFLLAISGIIFNFYIHYKRNK